MAKKTFLVNLDLSKNELQNAKLQNLATHPTVGITAADLGFVYWNTVDKTAYFLAEYTAGPPIVAVWKSLEAINTLTSDITVTLADGKTLGKYVSGDTIPAIRLTLETVLRDIALEYVHPVFTAFSVTGQATTIEVGTLLSGSKTFT
jgi:hypothetical protein